MGQRDLLRDQIEQIGKVLATLLSDFLGLKSKGEALHGIEITNQRLQEQLNIQIEKLVTLTKTELKEYLKTRKLTAERLEILSDYVKEIGIVELETNKRKA
ncbi:MAG: hypothetical protein AAGA64_13805 [Bacteroidota bacterium]